jgi:hypothetical protein
MRCILGVDLSDVGVKMSVVSHGGAGGGGGMRGREEFGLDVVVVVRCGEKGVVV